MNVLAFLKGFVGVAVDDILVDPFAATGGTDDAVIVTLGETPDLVVARGGDLCLTVVPKGDPLPTPESAWTRCSVETLALRGASISCFRVAMHPFEPSIDVVGTIHVPSSYVAVEIVFSNDLRFCLAPGIHLFAWKLCPPGDPQAVFREVEQIKPNWLELRG